MAYIDSMLASGEQPIKRDHQHWFVLVADARYGIAAIVLAVILLVLRSVANTNGQFDAIVGWAVLALVVGGLAYIGWQILRWVNEEYVVTTRRVLQLEGVVNKRVLDSSLEKINDAVLTQSLFGRIFGFGDLDILTASESGISRFRMLVQPVRFKRAMLDAKHEYERDLVGSGYASSPPLRAESITVGGPPTDETSTTPMPMPVAPPAGEPLTRDEVTRTLNSLADLRDRGAISPEEYEGKKQDLLGRL
jgi:hypothetical protein